MRSDPQNRRRAARHAVNIEVDYAADSTFLYAYITDISSMGIFIRTDTPCEPGTTLRLRFTPPVAAGERPHPIEIDGEVKWKTREHPNTGEAGMGVEFKIRSEKLRVRLMELVRAIAYLSGDEQAEPEPEPAAD
ncbi:MAG: PilZ domain-containing protein [Nannocystaceae bacterium]